jgi:hypothetical protein
VENRWEQVLLLSEKYFSFGHGSSLVTVLGGARQERSIW